MAYAPCVVDVACVTFLIFFSLRSSYLELFFILFFFNFLIYFIHEKSNSDLFLVLNFVLLQHLFDFLRVSLDLLTNYDTTCLNV